MSWPEAKALYDRIGSIGVVTLACAERRLSAILNEFLKTFPNHLISRVEYQRKTVPFLRFFKRWKRERLYVPTEKFEYETLAWFLCSELPSFPNWDDCEQMMSKCDRIEFGAISEDEQQQWAMNVLELTKCTCIGVAQDYDYTCSDISLFFYEPDINLTLSRLEPILQEHELEFQKN